MSAAEVEPVLVGFVRGVAPAKWGRRWAEGRERPPMYLIPVDQSYSVEAAHFPHERVAEALGMEIQSAEAALIPPGLPQHFTVTLERTRPELRPSHTQGSRASRHAVRLYEEAVALVVPADHELAKQKTIDGDSLEVVSLLGYPNYPPQWPAPTAGPNPEASIPADEGAALDLVAAGIGAVLLPLPLARHLSRKKQHAVIPVDAEAGLVGSEMWATWAREDDSDTVQELVGVLRGRTARSSRSAATAPPAPEKKRQETAPRQERRQGGTRGRKKRSGRPGR